VRAVLAAALVDAAPGRYNPGAHPVDPGAVRDAEHLLSRLAEAGYHITHV